MNRGTQVERGRVWESTLEAKGRAALAMVDILNIEALDKQGRTKITRTVSVVGTELEDGKL